MIGAIGLAHAALRRSGAASCPITKMTDLPIVTMQRL